MVIEKKDMGSPWEPIRHAHDLGYGRDGDG